MYLGNLYGITLRKIHVFISHVLDLNDELKIFRRLFYSKSYTNQTELEGQSLPYRRITGYFCACSVFEGGRSYSGHRNSNLLERVLLDRSRNCWLCSSICSPPLLLRKNALPYIKVNSSQREAFQFDKYVQRSTLTDTQCLFISYQQV